MNYCDHCMKPRQNLAYAEIKGVPGMCCTNCRSEERERRELEEADTYHAMHVLDWERELQRREEAAWEEEERIQADREVRDWERGAHGWDDAP